MNNKKVFIVLTVEQHLALVPLIDEAAAAAAAGKPVALLGQLSPKGDGVTFAILPHETALKMVEITNPDFFAKWTAANDSAGRDQMDSNESS